jgi:hypothetical protein
LHPDGGLQNNDACSAARGDSPQECPKGPASDIPFISRLSEKLGMNEISVFRQMATFEDRGYVERKKSTGKFQLGLAAGDTLPSRPG